MDKLVSVIVPVYRVEKYLRKCLDSIIRQAYKDLEIIVVDDGSPDNCPAICDEYAAKDNRVKVIHKTNGGLSSARNAGLDVATGEYVLFVDSDDWIAPETVEKTVSIALQFNSDIVMFDFTCVQEDDTEFSPTPGVVHTAEQWTRDDFWRHCYSDKGCECVVSWNKLCKRTLFQNIRFAEGRIHEDEFILFDLIANASVITYVNTPFYYYLQRSGSIVRTPSLKSGIDSVTALAERTVKFNASNQNMFTGLSFAACLHSYYLFERNPNVTLDDKKNMTAYIKTILAGFPRFSLKQWTGKCIISLLSARISPVFYLKVSSLYHRMRRK